MPSNGDSSGGGPTTAFTLTDESTRRSWPACDGPLAGGVGPDNVATDRSQATSSLRRVEQEFDDLWRAAVVAGERAFAEQLVDVSHALRQAVRLLEDKPAIG